MNKNYRLLNDTAWPMPLDDDEIDLNCYHIETVTLTRHQAWRLRDIVGAYDHLVRHPAGVEAAIHALRLLRRAARGVT